MSDEIGRTATPSPQWMSTLFAAWFGVVQLEKKMLTSLHIEAHQISSPIHLKCLLEIVFWYKRLFVLVDGMYRVERFCQRFDRCRSGNDICFANRCIELAIFKRFTFRIWIGISDRHRSLADPRVDFAHCVGVHVSNFEVFAVNGVGFDFSNSIYEWKLFWLECLYVGLDVFPDFVILYWIQEPIVSPRQMLVFCNEQCYFGGKETQKITRYYALGQFLTPFLLLPP